MSKDHRKRLKERFLAAGTNAFSEHELLELLLTYAIPRKDTKGLAKELIATFGSLHKVLRVDVERLCHFKGLGEHSAILISLLGSLRGQADHSLKGQTVSSYLDVSDYFFKAIGQNAEEFFYIMLLDQKNKVIDVVEMEHGIENRAQVYIKKIVRTCLDRHATGLICIHNHPSGSAEFSEPDLKLTKEIKTTFKNLELRLLDHLLITQDKCVSMQEMGLL
ncbi:MAG: RadC family protein [Planctomycetes bacterium]|nr:RadC family protein [Planctomycetota bacterium]